jgi:hypothetical protein
MIKGVQTRVDSDIHPIALIENAKAIQAAVMHMIDAVLKGTIDNKRAALVLKALHIAVRNSRNVRFSTRPDDMVHEVPNYAQQYLSEHPELNPGPPSDAAAATPGEAPSPKKENQKEKESHPEQARQRESKDPHPAHSGNGASGNSHHPPERNREKARAQNDQPLTTRQSERQNEIKNLEASIEGAMHGNWRDLRTVFNAVGLTVPKPRAKIV